MNLSQLYVLCKNIIIAAAFTLLSVYVNIYVSLWIGKISPALITISVISGIAIIIKSVIDFIADKNKR